MIVFGRMLRMRGMVIGYREEFYQVSRLEIKRYGIFFTECSKGSHIFYRICYKSIVNVDKNANIKSLTYVLFNLKGDMKPYFLQKVLNS